MAYTTINKSSDYFNTKLYTGTGSSNAITGVGFQPDLVWLKPRNYADHHRLMDAVRGQYTIYSNRNVGQDANSSHFTSFDSDGFTLAGSDGGWNSSSYNYVSWNWRAGGGQGSSNTDGTINTTYTSVNTTSGFSICQWEGTGANATIGHGLGVVPKMYIVKNIDATNDWNVYHHSIGNTHRLFLNTTAAAEDNASAWNDTSPTSSVFSVGTNTNVNQSGSTMIAYVFAEKTGFSKFGKYTGNGNDDGTFVYTGFKPAFVLIKNTTTSGEWWVTNDSRRNPSNIVDKDLFPNVNNAEAVHSRQDFLSNGFKFRSTANNSNKNGDEYVYMAFAAAPLVGSNNVPCTAR